jgi:hypothetical protein
MKTNKILGALALVGFLHTASATIVVNSDWAVGQAVPDGTPVGMAVSQTFSGLDASTINGVDVRLQITGGYNGDLYGYLVLQDVNGHTATSLLLNRIGTSGSDHFGSAGSGFNVTLSDSGTVNGDIHNATGAPTGTWLADQYAGANSLNTTFAGAGNTANGTWTLFLADLSGSDQSTLVNWGLAISVVPEPVTWALLIFGGGLILVGICRWGRRYQTIAQAK